MKEKFFKKAVCFVCVLFITMHSFAAVVSDNDGSAFVTKAEFEGMKNSFTMQIENYNTSIDSKVDGAIASYLAGIKLEKEENIKGFVEVKDDSFVIYGRKKDYETIKKQFWNDLTCNMTCFGTAAGTAASYTPFMSNSDGGYPSTTPPGRYFYWGLKVQPATSLLKNMQGYQFNTDGVITGIYDDDQLVISISDTECADTWGSNRTVLAYVDRTSFTSQTLKTGQLYTNSLTIPDNRWSQLYYTESEISSTWANFLYDVETDSKTAGYASKEGTGTWNLANTFYAEHVQDEERKKYVNTYNEVDATIYAYLEGEKQLEAFCDPLSTYDISSNGRRWQLAMYNQSDNSKLVCQLSGYSWFYYNDRRNTTLHRYGLYVPKLKLKNTTTIEALKPTVQATDDTAKKFNNLNQFRNGYIKYTDKNGNTCYPKFYGGIPLFNMDNLTSSVKFDFKCEATTTGVNKVRIWVKEGEFPNANYNPTSSAWTSIDTMTGETHNDDLVSGLEVNGTKSTGKYVDISAGSRVTIKINDPKTKTPYFIRFAEVNPSGTCLNEGGKVTYLSNFVATTS